VRFGYQVLHCSVLVEAVPTFDESLPGAAKRQMYAVVDGHHRVAAVRALQVSGVLPIDYSIPVSILN
jgi:hypothetical protein